MVVLTGAIGTISFILRQSNITTRTTRSKARTVGGTGYDSWARVAIRTLQLEISEPAPPIRTLQPALCGTPNTRVIYLAGAHTAAAGRQSATPAAQQAAAMVAKVGGVFGTLRYLYLILPYLAYYDHLALHYGGPWCSPIPWWCN